MALQLKQNDGVIVPGLTYISTGLAVILNNNKFKTFELLEKDLENKQLELEKEFEGKEIPRPEFWGGYLIDVHHWEFWQGRKNRTHDRFSYSKVDTEWKTVRLSP